MASRQLLQLRSQKRAAEIKAFTQRLQIILGDSLDEVIGELDIGTEKGIANAAAIAQLEQVMREQGFTEELGNLRAMYGEELQYIRSQYKDLGIKDPFAGVDSSVIETLIRFDTDVIDNKVGQYLGDFKSQLMRGVLLGDIPTSKELREQYGDTIAGQISTELNTGLVSFNRTVTTSTAADLGLTLFRYIGPDDEITREFCENVLHDAPGAIYTIDEIEAMDNGQGLRVLNFGGGYNCRHEFRPLTLERAIELGYQVPG